MTTSKPTTHTKALKQMSLLVDSLVSPSRLQVKEKPYKTTDICGQKCLELLDKQNLPGSLGKMSEILLASQTAWYSNKCTLTWKAKVTKSNRLLYQLQQSTLPTKDTEHGLWRTPTTMDTKEDALKHATKLMQGKTHRASGELIQKTLADQIMMEEIKQDPSLMDQYKDHEIIIRPQLPTQQEFVKYLRENTSIKELTLKTDIKKTTIEHWFRTDSKGFSHPSIEDWNKIKPHLKTLKFDNEMTMVQSAEWTQRMWRTPDAAAGGSNLPGIQKALDEGHLKRPSGQPIQIRLQDQVKEPRLWPTPTARDYKDNGNPCWWNTEPDVGRMVDGLPNRVDRLKGLGNAIVPQIAYQIGMAIKEAENDS